MNQYDAILVGLGGVGSAAAYHLAARGQRVLGIEQFNVAHDLGSSHGRSRLIRQAYAEDPGYVPLVNRAYELWRQLERDWDTDLLTVTGGIMVGAPDSGLVTGARRSAERWDLPHEILQATEVHRRFPILTPAPHEVGVYEPNAGFVRPEDAILAHSGLARRLGADLHYGEQVTDWESTGDGVAVHTSRGRYAADRLVFCAGAWSPALLADLGVPMVVERQVMHWFEPGAPLEEFGADKHPVYLWEEDPDTLIYGFPAHDGQTTLKVAFYHRPGVTTPETINRSVDPAEIQEITEHLALRLPSVAGRHVHSKACMYTLTPDHHFVVGQHPRHRQVVIGAGFSGHGFKFTPTIGEILADLATAGRTDHEISLFDTARPRHPGPVHGSRDPTA